MNDRLAKVDPGGLAQVDVISALPAIFELSRKLIEAKGFLPQHFKSEGEVAAAIIAGRELGLPPMLALRSLYVVKGKVGLDASLQLALCKRAGIKHAWIQDGSDRKRAVLRLERSGEAPYEQSFTVEEAEHMGLMSNPVWRTSTPAMLRARCVSAGVRAYCPDVVSGVYVQDEIDNMIVDAQPVNDNEYARSPALNTNEPAMTVEAIPQNEIAPVIKAPTVGEEYASLIEALPLIVDRHGLSVWHEEFNKLSPQITQMLRSRGWAAWGRRCAALNLDPQALSDETKAARKEPVEEIIP